MDVEGFGVSNFQLECFFKDKGQNLSDNFVGVLLADEKSFWMKSSTKNKVSLYDSK